MRILRDLFVQTLLKLSQSFHIMVKEAFNDLKIEEMRIASTLPMPMRLWVITQMKILRKGKDKVGLAEWLGKVGFGTAKTKHMNIGVWKKYLSERGIDSDLAEYADFLNELFLIKNWFISEQPNLNILSAEQAIQEAKNWENSFYVKHAGV